MAELQQRPGHVQFQPPGELQAASPRPWEVWKHDPIAGAVEDVKTFGGGLLRDAGRGLQEGSTYSNMLNVPRMAGTALEWSLLGDVKEYGRTMLEAARLEEAGDHEGAAQMRQVAGLIAAAVLVPGPQGKLIKRGLVKDPVDSATIPTGSGGRPTPPSGVSSGVPQPLPTYPPVLPPTHKGALDSLPKKDIGGPKDRQAKWDAKVEAGEEYPATMTFPAKNNSPEALAVKKAVNVAQRDIDAGNYTPYFDVSKRADVDPSNYDIGPATLDVAVPKRADTLAKYEAQANAPDGLARLVAAYDEGTLVPNSGDWYFVKQMEDVFIRELGEEAGRIRFRERFTRPIAATTGGAAPKENLRTAMYGNYLREHNMPYPTAAHEMPYPAGGVYVSGNIAQHKKIIDAGEIDPVVNPKRFNFEENFLGNRYAGTIDKQISQLFDPKMAEPPGPSYGVFEGAVNRLADDAGVDLRRYQEAAWAGAKKQREGPRYPGSRPLIEEVNQMIERTSRVTGLSPDEVVVQGFVHSRIPMYGIGGAVVMGAAAGMLSQTGEERPGALEY